MALPEAWPVAISRGDFTAAAGWFCFSFDCFSFDCATATSDKHANPNTRILLFIFSLLCAGNGRHWLSRSERQTSSPHSDSEMLGACAGPRKRPTSLSLNGESLSGARIERASVVRSPHIGEKR